MWRLRRTARGTSARGTGTLATLSGKQSSSIHGADGGTFDIAPRCTSTSYRHEIRQRTLAVRESNRFEFGNDAARTDLAPVYRRAGGDLEGLNGTPGRRWVSAWAVRRASGGCPPPTTGR